MLSSSSKTKNLRNSQKNQNIPTHQLQFIKKCIANYEKSNEKKLSYMGDDFCFPCKVPKLSDFLIKPVYIIDIANQFNTILICKICNQKIAEDGWAQTYRTIDCLKSSAYLVQKKYKCNCVDNNSNFSGFNLLKSEKIPDYCFDIFCRS